MKNKTYPVSCLLICTMLMSMHSCIGIKKRKSFESQCDNGLLELYSISKAQWATEKKWDELYYNGDKIATIDMDALSNGKPYKDNLFGNTPWGYWDTAAHYYMWGNPKMSVQKIRFLLYIDPELVPQNKLSQIVACVAENLPAIQKFKDSDSLGLQNYQIAGWVYGKPTDFDQVYVKDKQHKIIISANGNITHYADEDGMTISSANGLANEIVGGDTIIIYNTGAITVDELRQYRHVKTDRPLEVDFTIHEDPKPISR